MPSELWHALRGLAIVRGYVRQSHLCDEHALTHEARETLGALRCVYAILQQIQPREIVGTTYEQSRDAILTALESLQENAHSYAEIEVLLASSALNVALEHLETVHRERTQ